MTTTTTAGTHRWRPLLLSAAGPALPALFTTDSLHRSAELDACSRGDQAAWVLERA